LNESEERQDMPQPARITRAINFLRQDIWHVDQSALSRPKAFLLKPARILLLAIQDFVRDRCVLRASALTFYSLLTVVPVAAMAFGFAQGFGLEERLIRQIYLWLPGQTEAVERIIGFARSLLENTQGGVMAGVGILVLFWSALKVLHQIEGALNDIWKVKDRALSRQFTNYITVMIFSPVLIILSSSMNVFIQTQVTDFASQISLLRIASPVIFFLLNLLPYALLWILFILIYMIMPNVRVSFRSAIIGGIISGTLYQLTQTLYIGTQVVVAKYNYIYGSFAALPLFLIWLQLSWMIVLIGAQIVHAHERVATYAMSIDYQNASPAARKKCALQIMQLIIRRFEKGDPPPDTGQIASELHLPRALVEDLLRHLVDIKLVSLVEASDSDDKDAYQPARDIQHISVVDLLEAWDNLGQNPPALSTGSECQSAVSTITKLYDDLRRSPANRLIKDL
jgi:membrane protein